VDKGNLESKFSFLYDSVTSNLSYTENQNKTSMKPSEGPSDYIGKKIRNFKSIVQMKKKSFKSIERFFS